MNMEDCSKNAGALVSVIVPTYNRRRYLPEALASVTRQDYEKLEIIVVRDGGESVRDIVESFNDPRIVLIDRNENRGIGYSLNEALADSSGRYICYLGDDDIYYPHHVGTLVNALEGAVDYQVAYSDLYRTYCRIEPDGRREVLGKFVEVSRDFDRSVMLYFNHVLHVSLIHRRDLIDKTGPYNEDLTVLLDWDLTRKLSFFADFLHIPAITGEYYTPMGESDRVSVRQRKDKNEYIRNVMTIRTTRPPKPWSRIQDVSILLTADCLNGRTKETLLSVWRHTFHPYQVYMTLAEEDFAGLDTDMPNLVNVAVDRGASQEQRLEAALNVCEGDYVAVVPPGFPIGEFWLEDSLGALIRDPAPRQCLELEGSTARLWAGVLAKDDLRRARRQCPGVPVSDWLKGAGIAVRRVLPEEIPFQFDQLLAEARTAEKKGDWAESARIYQYTAGKYGNEIWIKSLAANAFFMMGDYDRSGKLFGELNRESPTVDTLLAEARVWRGRNDFESAIRLLERAEQTLTGREFIWI